MSIMCVLRRLAQSNFYFSMRSVNCAISQMLIPIVRIFISEVPLSRSPVRVRHLSYTFVVFLGVCSCVGSSLMLWL